MKPEDKLHKWPREPAYERIEGCRAMLYLHGFISESENTKAVVRIERWAKKHGFKTVRSSEYRVPLRRRK